MCRILVASSETPFPITDMLVPFAAISQNSREYQGHGWGCAWRENDQWQQYHCIDPVWDDPGWQQDSDRFPHTRLLLAHARSAFRDEGIVVENNMPFSDGNSVFIFNGELRGVRIKSEGRIGAEKIYNYIRRFDNLGLAAALEKGVNIIKKRSQYVRAMNIILSDAETTAVSCNYSEDPGYFQMQQARLDNIDIICSEPFPNTSGWQPLENGKTILHGITPCT